KRGHASSAMNGARAAGRWADACMAVTPCGFRRRLTGAGAAGSAKAVRIRHGRYFVRNVGGTATCVRGGNPRFTLMHLGGNVDWHRDTRCVFRDCLLPKSWGRVQRWFRGSAACREKTMRHVLPQGSAAIGVDAAAFVPHV